MSFLLDADTASAYLKGNRTVHNRLLQYTGGLHISTVAVAEIYTWVLRAGAPPRRLQSFEELLREVVVLDVTHAVARRFGEIRAALFDRGLPPPEMDLLIGATAIVHDLTFVTHNIRDFANIPDLRLVDWMVP